MRSFCFYTLIIFLILFIAGCSGGDRGGNSISSLLDTAVRTPEPQASEVENVKLQEAIQAYPIYKIENSEIEMMKTEGIITDEDVAQIQAIQ